MKNMVHTSAALLLYLVGISAVIGGWGLVGDPTGEAVGLPLSLLLQTPFRDFLYPGIILLAVVGLGSIITGSLAILGAKYYPVLITAQGLVLIGWIIIQAALINQISWLHYVYGVAGILLIGAGIFLYEWARHEKRTRGRQFA